MGMSHDFEVAIEEGSTCVRIGTAIFGTRANHDPGSRHIRRCDVPSEGASAREEKCHHRGVGDALKVALTAPPVEGRANEACIAFLADFLNVSRSSVTIAAGETSRK